MGLGFLLGLGITLYPAVSNYLLEKNQSTAMQGYIEEQGKVPDEVSEHLKQEAREYNEKLREGTVVLTDPFDPEALKYITDEYEEMLNPDGDGLMGYLEIPSIKVYLPVYHGTSDGVLQAGVGHLGNTSLPVGGENTHAVLSGHTGLPNARLLTDLDKLQEKDQFYLHVLDEVLAYEVDQIKIVEPDDISDIFIEDGKDYVTLVTCTPYGINSHRLLVRGIRVPYVEAEKEQQVSRQEESTWNQEYLHAIIVGVEWTAVGIGVVRVLTDCTGYYLNQRKEEVKHEENDEYSVEHADLYSDVQYMLWRDNCLCSSFRKNRNTVKRSEYCTFKQNRCNI